MYLKIITRKAHFFYFKMQIMKTKTINSFETDFGKKNLILPSGRTKN